MQVHTKSIIRFLGYLTGCLITISAHAVTYSVGTLGAVPYTKTPIVTGIFTDRYDFTVAGSPNVAATAVTINLSLGSVSYHITGLTLDLFSSSNSMLAADTVTGPSDISVNLNQTLLPGNYYFTVGGTADGSGTNQGIYTFSAAAVPEVDTYAMVLAGLGLVGFIVNRRK